MRAEEENRDERKATLYRRRVGFSALLDQMFPDPLVQMCCLSTDDIGHMLQRI